MTFLSFKGAAAFMGLNARTPSAKPAPAPVAKPAKKQPKPTPKPQAGANSND